MSPSRSHSALRCWPSLRSFFRMPPDEEPAREFARAGFPRLWRTVRHCHNTKSYSRIPISTADCHRAIFPAKSTLAPMEITFRDAVTVMHGMAFGGLLLLTFSGAGIALYAIFAGGWTPAARENRLLGWYFSAMAMLAWLTVF